MSLDPKSNEAKLLEACRTIINTINNIEVKNTPSNNVEGASGKAVKPTIVARGESFSL